MYELQAGTLALDLGEREVAGALFDRALVGITSVYANNEQAERARGLWHEEGSKDYKGEPYERAMAHYYRGLLDLYAADYENARASFKGGLLQDAFAEDAQHRADFALLMYLEGWCSHLLNSAVLRDEAYAELSQLRPAFQPPAPDHNLLVVVETGKSPRKLQDGIGGNLLVYRQGKRFAERGAQIRIGAESQGLLPMESIYWQASTRGGRPIDGILEGKIQFKSGTQQVSAVLSSVAEQAQLYAPLYGGGAGGAIAGVAGVAGLATLMTSGVKTKADNRYWNNLPDTVHVLSMRRPEGASEVVVEFVDANGRVIPELTQTQPIHVDARGNGLVWARSRRATDVDARPK